MLNIALCDDEPEQLALTGGLLRGYMNERPGLAARLTVFSSGDELLKQEEDGGGFDLYLLDVIMPGLSGIDLGLRLRDMGRDAPIVYLTTSPDFAVDSYLTQAFYYLLKPADPVQLYSVLDRASEQLQKRRAASVQVKVKNGMRLLLLDEILYAELAGRAVRYHLAGGETVNSVTLQGPFQSAVEALLADPRFVLCGSSFAVNLHYVTSVDKAEVTLRNGVRVSLPRGLSAGVKRRWGDYWLNGSGGTC